MMKQRICLSCKHYRLMNPESGRCRANAAQGGGDRPQVNRDHSCDRWTDAEQQYYIRIGWLKNYAAADN